MKNEVKICNKVKKYRKKPVIIEAIQLRRDNYEEVIIFCEGYLTYYSIYDKDMSEKRIYIINNIERNYNVSYGDYIIKDEKERFYSYKGDIFKMTYDELR